MILSPFLTLNTPPSYRRGKKADLAARLLKASGDPSGIPSKGGPPSGTPSKGAPPSGTPSKGGTRGRPPPGSQSKGGRDPAAGVAPRSQQIPGGGLGTASVAAGFEPDEGVGPGCAI